MGTLIGGGTLYDADENELGTVAYRIDHDAGPGDPILAWAGELNFDATADVPIAPGRYLLDLGDGTRVEIAIAAVGAASALAGQIAFAGVGIFDAPPASGATAPARSSVAPPVACRPPRRRTAFRRSGRRIATIT